MRSTTTLPPLHHACLPTAPSPSNVDGLKLQNIISISPKSHPPLSPLINLDSRTLIVCHISSRLLLLPRLDSRLSLSAVDHLTGASHMTWRILAAQLDPYKIRTLLLQLWPFSVQPCHAAISMPLTHSSPYSTSPNLTTTLNWQ